MQTKLAELFYSIFRWLQHRKAMFYLALPLIFVLLAYWTSRIRFEENITKLIPADESAAEVNRVLEAVTFTDHLVIHITAAPGSDETGLRAYADTFAQAISRSAGPLIEAMQVRLNDEQLIELVDLVSRNLPLFLDETDYRHIDRLLVPDSLRAIVAAAYETVTSPQHMLASQLARQDPLGLVAAALRKFQRLQSGGQFILRDGYLVTPDGQHLLAFITPVAGTGETAANTPLVDTLDRIIQQLNIRFQDVAQADYFGAAAVAVANARQIKRDIVITLSIAMIALIALFIYFYRQVTVPLIIFFPAVFGSLLGMAVLYALKGTVSAISIGIGSVLLGLTLDYSLHILSHYRGTGDVRQLLASTTKPLLMCAVFTAVDFLSLLFLQSDVLSDLGIFASISVLGAAVFALIFIPQVYTPTRKVTLRQSTFVDAIARYDFSRNRWLNLLALVLIVVSLFTSRWVSFNDDLAALNYQPAALKAAEQRLDTLTDYGAKSIYLVAYGESYDEAAERNTALYRRLESLEKQEQIHGFQSTGGVALSNIRQQEKLEQWHRFWSDGKRERLIQHLRIEGQAVGFRDNAFQPFFDLLEQPYATLKPDDRTWLDESLFRELVGNRNGLVTMTTVVKTSHDRAIALIDSLMADQAGVLAIDRKHLQERLLGRLEADFNNLFLISSVAVFVVIFLFFGSLELTLITNLPIFFGWMVTLGLMGIAGVQFNAFNIIITTLIFGLGVDYSIFVTKGLIEEYTYGSRDLPAYKAGVVMSALATLLCFGILVFARHPAIRSISVIPLIGLLVVVLMSFTIQPWLFRTFISGPQAKGNTPWRLINLALTGMTFGYFFLGGLLVSLIGQLFMAIAPLSRDKKLRIFQKTLQLFFHNLMYRTPGIRMNVVGRQPSHFDPPVIIIANHTSILDTPTMGLLHDRQVFMMNDRQLRSRFFGRAMRMVGAHPAAGRDSESVEQLRKKMQQGYSVIIFPEGTRSMTTSIQRFHKGAFYLAEQLQVDILPVLIHGNAHALPKNDNMLKPGPITMKYLPRIRYDNAAFGSTYHERTKRIGAYFRAEFRKLRDEHEPADYFRDKLYLNYWYKPWHIQREVRHAFRTNREHYHRVMRLLPQKGRFIHLGCGYGVLGFLLVYDSAERQLTGWDIDYDKIRVAQHTFTANRYPIRFHADLPATGAFDVVIVSGQAPPALQRFIPNAQWVVLENAEDQAHLLQSSGFREVEATGPIKAFHKA